MKSKSSKFWLSVDSEVSKLNEFKKKRPYYAKILDDSDVDDILSSQELKTNYLHMFWSFFIGALAIASFWAFMVAYVAGRSDANWEETKVIIWMCPAVIIGAGLIVGVFEFLMGDLKIKNLKNKKKTPKRDWKFAWQKSWAYKNSHAVFPAIVEFLETKRKFILSEQKEIGEELIELEGYRDLDAQTAYQILQKEEISDVEYVAKEQYPVFLYDKTKNQRDTLGKVCKEMNEIATLFENQIQLLQSKLST